MGDIMNTPVQGNTAATQSRNDFRPFAVNPDANVIEQAEYETLAAREDGFRKGLARSSELNKVMRQSSSMTAALARFAAARTDEPILDNGDIDTLSRQLETAISSVSSLLIAEADGSADALTAHFTPTVKELENGLLVHVRAKEKNTGTSPTFNADETGAKPVVKGHNLKLEMADIAGAGHWLEMQYDEALDKWVLQNPAKGITPPSGVPVGTIEYFAMPTPPAGYLKADGAAVGRQTYPELFETIGTTFGKGDGSTTFNLPDLINQFAQGSDIPGQKIEAGLPNIDGLLNNFAFYRLTNSTTSYSGAFSAHANTSSGLVGSTPVNTWDNLTFNARNSNPTYGASNTVQPPALTLLPCIKAFDATTNPGLIDITGLANEVASHKHVTETYINGTNWYRKWSDGWVEQGGTTSGNNTPQNNLLVPMQDANYFVTRSIISGYDSDVTSAKTWTAITTVTATQIGWFSDAANQQSNRWYVSGWAASA